MARKAKASTALPGLDKRYMEEDDARTLARASEIKADKTRFKGAQAGARRIIDEEEARVKGLRKVARKKK
jgi:hypothetical protein